VLSLDFLFSSPPLAEEGTFISHFAESKRTTREALKKPSGTMRAAKKKTTVTRREAEKTFFPCFACEP